LPQEMHITSVSNASSSGGNHLAGFGRGFRFAR